MLGSAAFMVHSRPYPSGGSLPRLRPAPGLLAATLLAGLWIPTARAQQVPDTTFDVRVPQPRSSEGAAPRLAISEGHAEIHTASGRYRPFAGVARADGFEVSALPGTFTAEALAPLRVLVIANAMGDPDIASPTAESSAFTEGEVAVVETWVRGGGALLLIADHAPFGAAMRTLGRAFGVDMRNGYCLDPGKGNASGQPGTIWFTASYGLDTSHAIVRGATPADRVDTVATFTGQSLSGPPGSRSLLTFSATAYDEIITFAERHSGTKIGKDRRRSAAGRSQALAFEHGEGRVVVLGEAAMSTAQLAGPDGRYRMGMNVPGNDNRRFVTNVLRWLARAS